MMKFTILNSFADIEAPVHHYDPSIFVDESDWYLRFERNVVQGKSGLCIAFGSSSELLGSESNESLLLPLQRSTSSRGLNILSSLENYYSVDFRPLCSSASARQQIVPMLQYILRVENPDVLCLRGLDTDAPETAFLLQALKVARWRAFQLTHQTNWVHNLTGDFDDYLEGRPGRLRSTLKRKTTKLMGLSGATMTIHDGQCDLEFLLKSYKRVYDNSWKVPEPYTCFIPELIRASAQRGHLRLGFLSIHNTPIAVHFWVVKHGIAFIYKLAHDKEYDRYSPGTVLMGYMVKQAMQNDGVMRLDFLSGDEPYKEDWMSVKRKKVKITAYNPRSYFAQLNKLRDEYALPFGKHLTSYMKLFRK